VTPRAVKATLQDILPLRGLFLQEANFQIRYDACHRRGWTDSYLLSLDDLIVGYGSIKGKGQLPDRDAIFECYVIPPFRTMAGPLFTELIAASGATHIEAQSNDLFTAAMLHEFAQDVSAKVVLFEDHVATAHTVPGALVRPRRESDRPFEHHVEPVGEYVVEVGGDIVATGGFLLHYNMPFADLYMEVREDSRRRGYGTFLLQEVKQACYLAARVPAARTSIDNIPSRATLTRAGLRVSGFMLAGKVKRR